MPRPRKSLLPLVLFFFALTLAQPWGCEKEVPKRPEKLPKPVLPKISIPATQLEDISLNERRVDKLAVLAPDTTTLDRDDLAQAFAIKNEKYLEGVMKLLQAQIQSGTPLNLVTVLFGTMPIRYAAQCAEPLPGDQCLITPVAFNCTDALPPKNWNIDTYHEICRSLGRLKAYKPEFLVALFDGDNTLWYQDVSDSNVKKGVSAKRVNWGPTKAELLSIYPPPEQRDTYKTTKTPYDYYRDLYKTVGPLWNYNYAALAFRGLPLKETFVNFQEAIVEPYAPQPFPEMIDLLRYLNDQGIITGVVSASPLFGVIPMVERLGVGIPLNRIEGLDVYLRNPNDPNGTPVRLSRLIDQGKLEAGLNQVTPFKTYQEVLDAYGDWTIVDVDQVIAARGGKGVAGRSIVRRYVAEKNRQTQKPVDMTDIEEMHLALIAGDNFAPVTDIAKIDGDRIKAAVEEGNDQGMAEALDFLPSYGNIPGGTDILFIRRYEMDDKNQVWPKRGSLKKFQEFIDQQTLLRPNMLGTVMTQEALTDLQVPGTKGGFLRERPTETESQASAESQPETVPTAPETKPTETQPAAAGPGQAPGGLPLPPAPTPPPMPTGLPQAPPATPLPPSLPQAPTPPGGLPGAGERPPPAMTPPTPATPSGPGPSALPPSPPSGTAPASTAPAPGKLAPLPPAPSANDALQ
jgi:phosphoglycolate phosphatase-like HAD superfamily hydrolase